jgi:hypothetical protein
LTTCSFDESAISSCVPGFAIGKPVGGCVYKRARKSVETREDTNA